MNFAQLTDFLPRYRFQICVQRYRGDYKINNFSLPALTLTEGYRCRWQVQLFFKWIKQHLPIQAFYGTSQNAVKTQIWIAIFIDVLVAILKKRLKLELSLYTILQILSLTVFEKTTVIQVLTSFNGINGQQEPCDQLNLFDL